MPKRRPLGSWPMETEGEDEYCCSSSPSSSSASLPVSDRPSSSSSSPSSSFPPSLPARNGANVCVRGTIIPPPIPPSLPPSGATTKALTGAAPNGASSLILPVLGSRRCNPPSGVAMRGPIPPHPGPGPSTSRTAAWVGVRRL